MTNVGRAWAVAFASAFGCTGGVVPEAPPPAPEVDAADLPAEVARALAERVAREVDCSKDSLRFLCTLTAIPGEPFEPPSLPKSWVGLSFALRPSRTVERGAFETLRVGRMTMLPDELWVLRVDQYGTNASLALPQIRLEALRAANGETPDLLVPIDLAAELDTRPTSPPATWKEDGGTLLVEGERPARLWRVPAADGRPASLVVVEPVDAVGGAFVSVFPEVPWRVPAAGAPL